MMGFSEGQIVLDSPNGAYCPGQIIYGKLIFQEVKAKTFRGIYVKVQGFCKVHWNTSHRRTVNGETKTVHEQHSAEEEYINVKMYLLGGESGECTIQPGKYELPFQCQVPHNCPSSFEGSKGHIRYTIKAVVDRAFKIDLEKLIAVQIKAPLDLNNDLYCKDPLHFEFNDTYCCCCINYGSADTVMKLPVAGYCPGQVIPIEIGCTNRGSVEISEIKFYIEKTIIFRSIINPAEVSETEKFSKTKTGPVAADTTRLWTVNVEIPDMDVPNVAACRFIDIEYSLKVSVAPSGCHRNSDGSRRIVIGTVPLVSFNAQVPNYMPVVNQPMVNASPSPNERPPYNVAPYPTNPHIPNTNSPYSNSPNTSYTPPNPKTPAYPAENPNCPSGNFPYPGNTPYPTGNSPYPPTNSPYPTSDSSFSPGNSGNSFTSNLPYPPPYSTDNMPYPTVTPYPPMSPPYPTQQQNMPYQNSPNSGAGLKTGTLGFVVQSPGMPSLPNPVTVPTNPYAAASAPKVD